MEFTPRNETIEEAIREYREARKELKVAEEKLASAGKILLRSLEDAQETTYNIEDKDAVYRATRVAPEKVHVDVPGLRKKIGVRAYNKLTTRTFHNHLLEKAVNNGELSLEDVQPFLSVKESTPYIRWSVKAKEDE